MEKFRIGFEDAINYVDGEEDRIIRKELKKRKLFNKSCLYSVFNGNESEQVEKTGTYRGNLDSIFAFTNENLVWESEKNPNCIKTHLTDNPAIAVYDKNQFYQDLTRGTNWEYFFKTPSEKIKALKAIALLKL